MNHKAQKLADTLRHMYNAQPRGRKAMAALVFGARYRTAIEEATLLRGRGSIEDIAEAGTGSSKYGTEIRKGMKLHEYFDIKERS